jgi:hypothetical protein
MTFRHGIMIYLACALVLSGAFIAVDLKTGGAAESAFTGKGLLLATTHAGGNECNAPVPNLLDAVPGDHQITITWSDEHAGDAAVTGYNIYYDKDGKSQPVTSVWPRTTYTNTALTNGQQYCYKVTSLYAECESGFSNVKCAVPAAQGPQD